MRDRDLFAVRTKLDLGSPGKIAQRSQYLMPIYAKSSKTNCEHKVKTAWVTCHSGLQWSFRERRVWHTWQVRQWREAR